MARPMFDVDVDELELLELDIKQLAKKAYPVAVLFTLNDAVRFGRREAVDIVRKDMIIRNAFTIKSIQFDQATGFDVNRMQAVLGSTQKYMKTQEMGGIELAQGKEGIAIPTSFSSGEGENTQPRRKMPTRANKRKNIRLRKTGAVRAKNQRQARLIKVKEAIKNNSRYIFMDTGRRKGIFRVEKQGKDTARLRMVHDLTRKSVSIPSSPWLMPASETAAKAMPGFYRKNIIAQLRRNGIKTMGVV